MNEDDFELEFEKTKEHFADVAEAYERWKADGKEPHLFVPPTRKRQGLELVRVRTVSLNAFPRPRAFHRTNVIRFRRSNQVFVPVFVNRTHAL